MIGAAETDPVAAGLLRDIQRQRATGQRTLTRNLARLGALRNDLTERRAADIVYAIMSPETYRLLVLDRRWSVRRYEEWLYPTMCEQLLERPTSSGERPGVWAGAPRRPSGRVARGLPEWILFRARVDGRHTIGESHDQQDAQSAAATYFSSWKAKDFDTLRSVLATMRPFADRSAPPTVATNALPGSGAWRRC